MLKENNLFKLVIFVPILFIILTASFITLIHIKQADKKFQKDSIKLTKTFLDEEKLKLNAVLESINSYVLFKQSTVINLLKDRVKSRLELADSMLIKIYNNLIGIESKKSIKLNLMKSLNDITSLNQGKYFIYDIKELKSKSIDKNKLFIEINKILKEKNEGFVFFGNEICYIKKFELTDIVIGYCENSSYYEEMIKDNVFNVIDLMKFEGEIFTLNKDLKIIQNSVNKNSIGKKFTDFNKNKTILHLIREYTKQANTNHIFSDFKYFWNKVDNNYNLMMFVYIKDWDWIVCLNREVKDINKNITELIGIKEAQRNETINESIKAALIIILFASLISFIISYYIYTIIKRYRKNIEKQKNVLKILNFKLEEKVAEKTKELEFLNEQLIEKFKEEVNKNKQKDQLLSEQSKLASMGEMIGHIAHQWRQPLSTISIIASGNYIKIDYDMIEKEELKKDFQLIVDQSSYLSATIDDFRNFFITDKKISKFNICDIIEKDLNLLSAILKKSCITVITNFNFVEINSIKNELLQAVLNILNNAKDVLIEKNDEDKLIVIDIYNDEKSAVIKIQDSGGGIKEDYLEKIFASYFTTKDKSKGTGLGLHMTKQIIENNLKGKIEVSNEDFVNDEKLYFGACFTITLPINF